MTELNECLMKTIMKAASDLINTYDSGLSDETIKERMLRIADDLEFGVDACEDEVGEIIMKQPTIKTLERWMSEGGCKALDGCWVEIDGTCPHGYPSWAIEMGLV